MKLDKGTGFEAQSFVMSVIFHTVFHTAHNISRWCCHSIYISISWAGSESFLWSSGWDAAFAVKVLSHCGRHFQSKHFEYLNQVSLGSWTWIPGNPNLMVLLEPFLSFPLPFNELVFGDFYSSNFISLLDVLHGPETSWCPTRLFP